MSLYLEISGGTIDLSSYEDDIDEIALEIMALLGAGEDWVRMRSEDQVDWVSEWTVLERSDGGVPTQIGYRGFDGALELIDNSRE